ncbi:MAG: TonB-dependent receptor [Bacteroidia bacterium]
MKAIRLFSILFLLTTVAFSQQSGVKGTIKDATTGEALIGVNIVLSNGKGGVTDVAGNFFIAADSGSYTAQIIYVGYLTQTIKVNAGKKTKNIFVSMESRTLTQVEIISDIAQTRETPVAFSNIDAKRIEEELASRDIPMLLTSTPGVYATMGGGGAGDGRVNIRGFDQSNVGILIDGIPTNDMETGAVYWSDWAGLGDITRNIQIQRGLGASKLAVSSVGGTINIITKGIDAKPSISYSQEYGSDMMLKEQLCATTGRMKGDWGLTIAGSRKTGDGWVDQTPYSMWSYFVKAEKRIKNHTISISANSAPQTHEQRAYNQYISTFDKSYAEKLGVNLNYYAAASPSATGNYGIGYNQLWGPIDRWTGNVNKYGIIQGDTISHNKSNLNTKVNYFNKPLYNLNDYWRINDKLYLSSVFYVSTGTGGGTTIASGSPYYANGQMNLQAIYNANYTSYFGITTLAAGHNASDWIYSSVNNHKWVGGLSTLTYKPNKTLTVTVGPDLRWYKGSHYYQVYDLLGADYMVDYADQHNNYTTNPSSAVKRVGDIYGKNYDDYVNYGGGFLQTEYLKNKWSTFATLTYVQTSYRRINNFDTSVFTHKSPLKEYYGGSAKAGANYNINDHHNVYLNAGYIIKAPPFTNVFDYGTIPAVGVVNQKIASVELGYGFKSRYVAANLNAYYTDWQNRPLTYPIAITDPTTGNVTYGNVNGINALHKGIELDYQIKPIAKVTIGGIASFADWKWNSSTLAHIYDQYGNLIDTVRVNAKGIHVANAPQQQIGLNVRYEPFKNFYVKVQWTRFMKQYAQFTPEQLNPSGNPYFEHHPGIDAWRIPDYQLVDLHVGYKFKLYKHYEFNLAAHVLNLLNTEYISEATNGAFFDATTSMVYFGQPRSFLLSMKISFF